MGGWGAWLLGKIRAKKMMNEWLAELHKAEKDLGLDESEQRVAFASLLKG